MTMPRPTFSIPVMVTNPGQFFACCGLLELAHRVWPGAEGWFDEPNGNFHVRSEAASASLDAILNALRACEITGLTASEKQERDQLERTKRELQGELKDLSKSESELVKEEGKLQDKLAKFAGRRTLSQAQLQKQQEMEVAAVKISKIKSLSEAEKSACRVELKGRLDELEPRRVELGKKARKGVVIFGPPFSLTLDWWQSEDEETPKTWSAQQEIHRIAAAARAGLEGHSNVCALLDWSCVLRPTAEYRKTENEEEKKVEPFYFDARRYVHALDTGFSLDKQKIETIAHPAVELLALVGLQRFRPVAGEARGILDYFVWTSPLPPLVASAVAAGAVPHPDARRYYSRLRYRDNQRRYKAFSRATAATELNL